MRSVTDLRDYKSILDKVTYGSPVYLTENGRYEYAIITAKELDELMAMRTLMRELAKGEESTKDGWISIEDVEKKLGI
jgi:PHD/YefM family antitoxin component YafN of YafNO toxin-antitoxin module